MIVFYVFLIILSRTVFGNIENKNEEITPINEEIQMITNVSTNITLPCWPKSYPHKNDSIYWLKDGKLRRYETVLPDGSLFIPNLTRDDTKLYTCRTEDDHIVAKVHLYVRGPPSRPENVSVDADARDVVVVWVQPMNERWQSEMGGVPTFLALRYHIVWHASWIWHSKALPSQPNYTRIFNLLPDSTYVFEVWSHNEYGRSESVIFHATTIKELNQAESVVVTAESSYESGFNVRSFLTALAGILFTVNFVGVILLSFITLKNRRFAKQQGDNSEQIELIPNVIENPTASELESESAFENGGRSAPVILASPTIALSSHKGYSNTTYSSRMNTDYSDFV